MAPPREPVTSAINQPHSGFIHRPGRNDNARFEWIATNTIRTNHHPNPASGPPDALNLLRPKMIKTFSITAALLFTFGLLIASNAAALIA